MKLQLKRPMIFFDVETTGIDVVNDRILEISILKISPNGMEESKTMRINPTIPIPPESTKIHGISQSDVEGCPTFAEVAKSIAKMFQGSDIAGYNSIKFDIPILAEELLRAGLDVDLKKSKFVDAQVIFFKLEQRTLSAAYKYYCGKELVNAHSAEADTRATFEVLEAQIERYDELQNDVDFLSEFSIQNNFVDFAGRIVLNEKGVECFNFGKNKGVPVIEVLKKEPGYYNWMMNADFPLYTKKVLTMIKLREAFANTTIK